MPTQEKNKRVPCHKHRVMHVRSDKYSPSDRSQYPGVIFCQ